MITLELQEFSSSQMARKLMLHHLDSAELLDAKMRQIRESGKVTGLDRIAVMAALNMANELLQARGNRIRDQLRNDMTDEALVEAWFWTVLSRPPSDEERAAALAHLQNHSDRRVAVQDLVWGLVNSAEFLLRH